MSPAALVEDVLMGPGVAISNVTFNGEPGDVTIAAGVGPSEVGRFDGSNTSIGIGTGIFLCTNVAAHHLPGPNDRLDPTGGGTAQGIQTPDLDLSLLTGWPYAEQSGGTNIYNKSVLEFDLIPFNDLISFRYVFSSEEYERWACSQYNDAFGLFISGPGIPTDINGPFTNDAMNIAFIPGSLSPVSINTVNSGLMNASNANGPDWADPYRPCFDADPNWQANAIYYRYNGGQWPSAQPPFNVPQLEAPYNTDSYYIQHNGMTVVLTANAAVQIGETYHIKMGVANAFDSKYPSAVFLEQGSFRSSDRFTLTVDEGSNVDLWGDVPVLHESDMDSVYLRFNRWGGFYLDEHLQIAVEGDAVAGVDYLPALPDNLHFDQLDPAAVVPLAIPVHAGEPRELIVHLITSNGDKVQTFHFLIDEQLTVDVNGTGARDPLAVLLDPTTNRLRVTLPRSMQGRAELQVSDMAGRVVMRQA
ncbi:MAG: choice-of-anchor L domain-containing protein, partial [Bacteroidetes bacterium]|nr:choice-of-anchor L domain-containing protein [Bacteroidota bacterium]